MNTRMQHLIITGAGFIGSNLRKHFESTQGSKIKVWTAGRAGTQYSLTSIVGQNALKDFGVILSGWGGVASAHAQDAKQQKQSLDDFEKQLQEVAALRPSVTLGFGSQIEKSVSQLPEADGQLNYAQAKFQARNLFFETMESTGLVGKWIYIYSIYGQNMDASWLLPQLLRAGAQGVPLSMGPCGQKWGLLHISDFVRAIETIVNSPTSFPRELDVGGEATKTLRDLVLEVEKTLGQRCATFDKEGLPSTDSVPDLAPLQAAGWTQRVTLRQGVLELKDRYV